MDSFPVEGRAGIDLGRIGLLLVKCLDHLFAYKDRHLFIDTQCNGIGGPAVNLDFPSILINAEHCIEGALVELVNVDALEFP